MSLTILELKIWFTFVYVGSIHTWKSSNMPSNWICKELQSNCFLSSATRVCIFEGEGQSIRVESVIRVESTKLFTL